MRGKSRLGSCPPERPICTPATGSGATHPAGTVEKSSALGNREQLDRKNTGLAVATAENRLPLRAFVAGGANPRAYESVAGGVRPREHRSATQRPLAQRSFSKNDWPQPGVGLYPICRAMARCYIRLFPYNRIMAHLTLHPSAPSDDRGLIMLLPSAGCRP